MIKSDTISHHILFLWLSSTPKEWLLRLLDPLNGPWHTPIVQDVAWRQMQRSEEGRRLPANTTSQIESTLFRSKSQRYLQQRIERAGDLRATNDVTKEAFHEPILLGLIVHRLLQLCHQFLVLHYSLALGDVPNFPVGRWRHYQKSIYHARISKLDRRLFDQWMESICIPRKASFHLVPVLPQSFGHALGYAVWSLEAHRRRSHRGNSGAARRIRLD